MVITHSVICHAHFRAEGEAGIYSTFDARKVKQRGMEQPVGPVVWEPYGRR